MTFRVPLSVSQRPLDGFTLLTNISIFIAFETLKKTKLINQTFPFELKKEEIPVHRSRPPFFQLLFKPRSQDLRCSRLISADQTHSRNKKRAVIGLGLGGKTRSPASPSFASPV